MRFIHPPGIEVALYERVFSVNLREGHRENHFSSFVNYSINEPKLLLEHPNGV
jgi:hypothetical protein